MKQAVSSRVVRRARGTQLGVRGAIDVARLRRRHPEFPSASQIKDARRNILDSYQRYVTVVSSPGMAASLETSALLLAICRVFKPAKCVDLGSGFSSYVLRVWAEEGNASVTSVDDDSAWLDRTQEFLSQYGLLSGNFSQWPVVPDEKFDLVFHDLAMGDIRETAMPVALHLSSRFVLFDDAHHETHRATMITSSRAVKAELYNLRSLTLDNIRRFAMLAERTDT